jgi:diguanylate cyclase (GGDEF)-like protein
MDGLKRINDTHGHEAGSQALKEIAGILRHTFRSSDIIARIGGDEFVILETSAEQTNTQISISRLLENIRRRNAETLCAYELSLSIGIVRGGFDNYPTVEALLMRGDELMYEEKRSKRRAPGDALTLPD